MAIEIPDKLWSWIPVVGPLRTMAIKTYEQKPITIEDTLAAVTGGATTVVPDVASHVVQTPKAALWIVLALLVLVTLLVVI